MATWIELLLIIIGIVVMLRGADFLVTKAEKLGRAMRWSPVLVGIAVVAVGTSLPELMVSVLASIQGHPLIATGNIIGSNITNVGLIVGLAALVGEIKLSKKTVHYDIPLSIAPIAVLIVSYILKSPLTATVGIALLLAYVVYVMITAREYEKPLAANLTKMKFNALDGFILVLGIVMLIAGAEVTLRFTEDFFTKMGVSDVVIGAIVLSLGTSLPELIATLTAVVKKKGQMAVGNILGSNVFNILGVLGASSLFATIHVTELFYEIIFLGVISVTFLLVSEIGKKHVISKFEGAILCLIYAVYVGFVTFVVR